MSSNYLMNTLLVEWVSSFWCSLNVLLCPGDLEQGIHFNDTFTLENIFVIQKHIFIIGYKCFLTLERISELSNKSFLRLKICLGVGELPWATWLATTRATSSFAAGRSSPRSSVPGSSSSSWLLGKTWSTKTTIIHGGHMLLDISWLAARWFVFQDMQHGSGSLHLVHGERLVLEKIFYIRFNFISSN